MAKFFKRKTVGLIAKILAVITIISVASACIFAKPKDAKTIGPTKFVIGKITDKGEFLKSDDYICTNKLIGVDDLTIKPDYDAKSKYQIFFYDFEYRFLGHTDVLDTKYEFLNSVPFAEYCRIMIIPDRGEKTAEAFKVTLFDKADYVKEFNITVNKKQVIASYKDYFEEDLSLKNKRARPDWDRDIVYYDDAEGFGVSKRIDVTGVNTLYFTTNRIFDIVYAYVGYGLNGETLFEAFTYKPYTEISDVYVYKIDCSKFNSVIFNYYLDSECHLFLEKN